MLQDKHPDEIREMINEALYEGDESCIADIARKLLDEVQVLRAIKVWNEKYIKRLENKE